MQEEAACGLDFFVRTADEWKPVIAHNPFREEAERDPSHLVVFFLKDAPDAKDVAALQAAITGPEIVRGQRQAGLHRLPNWHRPFAADEHPHREEARHTDFVDIEGDTRPRPSLRTRAKMLWDDEYFYVGAELEEPHLWATLTKHDSVIFQDHDFEVFIDPNGDSHEYYEFEINVKKL